MTTWKRIAGITLAATAVAAAVAGGTVVYTGIYNVAATEQHTAPVYYLIELSLKRSVKQRTDTIHVPDLNQADRALNGLKHFQTHCVQCHGAPGIAPEPFARGLTPAPASLVAAAQEWPAADVYWIVQQGIKMTGMPAWKYRLTDDEIWDVVAFMKVLPTLSPTDYAQWSARHAPSLIENGPNAIGSTQATQKTIARAGPARADPAESAPALATTARDEAEADIQLGDAGAGRKTLQQYLCATCHVIPGIVGANRHVGPPLTGIASRQYIAGVLPNTPANMVQWLLNPKAIDPLSAMPDLGVTEQDALDIAAFLYTLQEVK